MERLDVGHVRQNSELVLYALWDPQPVKADECISDVITGPQTIVIVTVVTGFNVLLCI